MGQIRQDARIRGWGVNPILAMPGFWEHLVPQPLLYNQLLWISFEVYWYLTFVHQSPQTKSASKYYQMGFPVRYRWGFNETLLCLSSVQWGQNIRVLSEKQCRLMVLTSNALSPGPNSLAHLQQIQFLSSHRNGIPLLYKSYFWI